MQNPQCLLCLVSRDFRCEIGPNWLSKFFSFRFWKQGGSVKKTTCRKMSWSDATSPPRWKIWEFYSARNKRYLKNLLRLPIPYQTGKFQKRSTSKGLWTPFSSTSKTLKAKILQQSASAQAPASAFSRGVRRKSRQPSSSIPSSLANNSNLAAIQATLGAALARSWAKSKAIVGSRFPKVPAGLFFSSWAAGLFWGEESTFVSYWILFREESLAF